jgi:hypothetical protein
MKSGYAVMMWPERSPSKLVVGPFATHKEAMDFLVTEQGKEKRRLKGEIYPMNLPQGMCACSDGSELMELES